MPYQEDVAAFQAALKEFPNATLAISNGVLRVEHSTLEPALVIEWFDGSRIWRTIGTESVFELHKARARLHLSWAILFRMMDDAMESDPPALTIEPSTISGNVDLWLVYTVSGHVTMRASLELSPAAVEDEPIARRALEILLAQIRESATERKGLLERVAALESQLQAADRAGTTSPRPAPEPSPVRIRRPKRPRRALLPHTVPKGTRLKEGF